MAKPSASSGASRPARSSTVFAVGDPGARLVLTHGGTDRPRATARCASRPAAISSLGSDVLVQLVIAAIAIGCASPPVASAASALSILSCGRRGPAMPGLTAWHPILCGQGGGNARP